MGQLEIPVHFAFTYVQTILLLCFTLGLALLSRKEKNFMYATHTWLVGLPICAAGWVESTMCLAFVRDAFYGHVMYDGTSAVGSIVWYVTCYLWAKSQNASTKVQKS